MNAPVISPEFVPGTVWLVGAGPGDPGLLTLHAARALALADVILHDALVSSEVLALANARATLEPVGKRAGGYGARQIAINERLIALARSGLRVVRLKGGDPLLFGRGGEEALALVAAGVGFRIIPGISAALGAAAATGIPLTHRGFAHTLTFATGHDSTGEMPADVDWAGLARGSGVIVLYMALGNIGRIAAAVRAAGRSPEEPVALVAEATTLRQTVRFATLATVARAAAELPRSAPTLILIGPVVALSALLAPGLRSTPLPAAA